MCLPCSHEHPVIKGDDIKRVFYPDYQKLKKQLGTDNKGINALKKLGNAGSTLHTGDGRRIKLNEAQMDEICDHALGIIVTGIDMHTDIWAIQWPTEYEVKTFK